MPFVLLGARPRRIPLEAFLTSTAVVALAEIGDKTMLLAIVLAARFKAPLPIAFGILFATLANHAFAAFLGERASFLLEGTWFRYLVALSFIAMAAWTLVPDTFEEEDEPRPSRFGAFVTTLVTFFLVEIGDKTQVATIALGAQFQNVPLVTAGTTLGMMIANVPAVLLGKALIARISLANVRAAAALLFFAVGVWLLVETAGVLR